MEPRIAARLSLTDRLSLKAAFGVYHQPPMEEDLSAAFGTPTLGLSVGATRTRWRELEAVGEARGRGDRIHLQFRLARGAKPRVGARARRRRSGRKAGAFLRRPAPSAARSGRPVLRMDHLQPPAQRAAGRAGPGLPPLRLRPDARPHGGRILDLGHGFEVGGRFRLASGYPRTPVIGAYYDAASDRYQPLFGERNSDPHSGVRLVRHPRDEAAAIKKTELELYLDIQNATNRQNPEELVYDPTFVQQSYISGFPILPMLGARWSW